MPAHSKEPISNPSESQALVERAPVAEPPALTLKEALIQGGPVPCAAQEAKPDDHDSPCGPTVHESHVRRHQQRRDSYS